MTAKGGRIDFMFLALIPTRLLDPLLESVISIVTFRDFFLQMYPDERTISSDWSINSFMVVCENMGVNMGLLF